MVFLYHLLDRIAAERHHIDDGVSYSQRRRVHEDFIITATQTGLKYKFN